MKDYTAPHEALTVVRVASDSIPDLDSMPASYAYVGFRHGRIVRRTNGRDVRPESNIPMYQGCMEGLHFIGEKQNGEVVLQSDSKDVIQQLNGEQKVDDPVCKYQQIRVQQIAEQLDVRLEHIPVEANVDAREEAQRAFLESRVK